MINNIIEKRTVKDGRHSLMLEIPIDDYQGIYDEYNNEIAAEILEMHLENRADDGRPTDIQIQHGQKDEVVRILANIEYLGNDHTEYRN
ncbi:MAG: hypothetical protein GX962_11415 [Epulopiscium sp.]|nr:hypothetical protein [Candidatus Epulonipiscium sp.]